MKPDVGQIWRDCDWRNPDRQVRIVMTDGATALCFSRSGDKGQWRKVNRRIRLDRFRPNSTGYEFLRYAGENE